MNVALIGYGYWGKIVEKYIAENPHLKLISIYTSSKSKTSFEQILENESIKAVFICTPINTHIEYVKRCLLAHKHVFCEKPLGKNVTDTLSIMRLAERQKRIVYTDYIYCQSPSIRLIKQVLPQIGNLVSARFELSQYGKFYSSDNVWDVLGVHLFSVLFYLNILIDIEDLDILNLSVDYVDKSGNIQAGSLIGKIRDLEIVLVVSLVSPVKNRVFEIIGSSGILNFDMLREESVIHTSFEKKKLNSNSFVFNEKDNLSLVMQDFVDLMTISKYDTLNMDLSNKVTRLLEIVQNKILIAYENKYIITSVE